MKRLNEREKQTILGLFTVFIIIILLASAFIGLFMSRNSASDAKDIKKAYESLSEVKRKPTNATNDGGLLVQVGSKKDIPTVEFYLDPLCPACAQIDRTLNDDIGKMYTSGQIKLEIHPVIFLDKCSSDHYSARVSGSIAYISEKDPKHVVAFISEIFDEKFQPSEVDYVEMSDEKIIEQAIKAGISREIAKESLNGKYDEWIEKLKGINAETVDELVEKLVTELNTYKNYIDINLIFDSEEDFLYRQKGQLKLDNTVIEEFMPIFVKKCVEKVEENCDIEISSQIPTFSSVYFASSLSNPNIGGGINIKTKDQDFSMSRKLYLQSSYDPQFNPEKTVKLETHLGYVLAEMKTNLDKTMFQEASATAHDIKQAVTGAKYYLLCDYLDMTPISTTTTDIDEILILRKAKRISSNIRKEFSTKIGREKWRPWYTEYLMNNPYSVDMFKRFINHIFSQMSNEELIEESVLEVGYF